MQFLCANHQAELTGKSPNQLSALWFEWMSQGSIYYDVKLYKEAQGYAGSAMDIGYLLLGKVDPALFESAAKKYVLASIYAYNVLRQQGNESDARQCLLYAYQRLAAWLGEHKGSLSTGLKAAYNPYIQLCLNILLDESQHIDYFEKHVNLSIETVNRTPAYVLN